jgi:heme oxygenase
MRPGLDLASYAAILQRFAAAYARIEPPLLTLAPGKPARLPDYKPRLPALRADLAGLGATAIAPGRAPLELPPGADTTAHYLGMRYVLEGATQGARLISARLEANLPQLRAGCFAYWRLQREAAADWPALCDCLDQGQPDQAEDLLRAAEAAFGVFIDAFDALAPAP